MPNDDELGSLDRDILGDQLDRYRDAQDPANVPPCQTCGGRGEVPVERVEYVSRDMAIDAGDRDLEGSVYHAGEEWVDCPDCPKDEGDGPF
jgi:hypothetical protein